MPEANKKSKYHHGDLKETLICHALSIVDNEGMGGLTLRKAARHAGVSHAAPAHHFGDKKGLLAAIAQKGFSQLALQMEETLQQCSDKNPLQRLRGIGLTYIDFAAANRSAFKVMYHLDISDTDAYPELEKKSMIPYDILKKALRECQKEQCIVDQDIEKLALFAWSTVHGFANLVLNSQLNNKGLDDDSKMYAEDVVDFLYTGLRRDM